jgi:valyl-tRNA synthetase
MEEETEKLNEELKYSEGFLKSIQGKLKNERFVNNAPEKVVAIERQKEADALAKIETLKKSLASLK